MSRRPPPAWVRQKVAELRATTPDDRRLRVGVSWWWRQFLFGVTIDVQGRHIPTVLQSPTRAILIHLGFLDLTVEWPNPRRSWDSILTSRAVTSFHDLGEHQ